MKKTLSHNMLMHGFLLVTVLTTARSAETEITMEAAFQGHCGHTSPCEQLCYEIHDGMYECDCIEGYELNRNGYSCQVINSTSSGDGHSKSDEDVLYQKGASFSAKLANDNQLSAGARVASSASGSEEDTDDTDIFYNDSELANYVGTSAAATSKTLNVNSNDYYISAERINLSNNQADLNTNNYNDVPEFEAKKKTVNSQQQQDKHSMLSTAKPYQSGQTANNWLHSPKHRPKPPQRAIKKLTVNSISTSTTQSPPPVLNTQSMVGGRNIEEDYYLKPDMSIYDDVNNNQLNLRPLSSSTYQRPTGGGGYTISKNQYVDVDTTTKIAPTSLVSDSFLNVTDSSTSESCDLDCGVDGICDRSEATKRCLCAFGKTGNSCTEDLKVRTPKFSKRSWLAFPALRGAYKHVQIRIEFRPESFDGIILLSGERDDLTGDFMALLLNKGFAEFWFDCGSGVGSVRSKETILLNEWNSVIIYRHRWDAWLVLNHGTRVQGRSNGLFSRITFREPVFLGGTGNITGLAKRLPIHEGFVGCIRRFVANEHEYTFEEHPLGDVTKGFDIQDCVTDKCFKYPCQHGGKCLPSDQGAVCLCPIGFVGDLCEIRMDLQVPAFNGSSFLRYAPLGDSALIWLELKIILKPQQPDGIILYSGPEKQGDFIALSLTNGFVEFAFELGSGPAVVRSEHPLSIGQWHTIKISRTARLAVLKIDNSPEIMTISSNGFWHLSLPHNLFLGGVVHMDKLPLDLKFKPYFVGCIQKIDINGHALAIVSEALGGTNIGNCPHACVARPCGPLAQCIPQMEGYECRCSAYNAQCNKAAEVPMEVLQSNRAKNRSKTVQTKQLEFERKMKKMDTSKEMKNKKKYVRKSTLAPITKTTTMRTTTVAATTVGYNNEDDDDADDDNSADDDIIFRDVHAMHRKNEHKTQRNPKMKFISKYKGKDTHQAHHMVHLKQDPHHKHIEGKLSRMPAHYESFQTNPESDILTFDNIEVLSTKQDDQEADDSKDYNDDDGFDAEIDDAIYDADDDLQVVQGFHLARVEPKTHEMGSFETLDESLFDENDQADEGHRKQFAQDMRRIMTNSGRVKKPQIEPQHVAKETKTEMDSETEQKIEPLNSDDWKSNKNEELYLNDDVKTANYDIITNNDDAKDDDIDSDDDIDTDDDTSKDDEDISKDDDNSMKDDISTNDDIDTNEDDYDDNDDLLEPVAHENTQTPATQAQIEPKTQTDWSVMKRFDLTGIDRQIGVKKNFGACFSGVDSYFHYNDAETMSQIISYDIDLNLRIKTHSRHGVILWTGRQSYSDGEDDDADFFSLGIENGYLHFRYDLGTGEVDIRFNMTNVSDGLWHRVRAIRDSQEGYLEVDGRKSITQRSPGRLRQLNTDTGLYVGGMPDVSYFTRRKYTSGIVGCISEIVLAGQLKLNFDPNTLGAAHNVETGIL